MSDGYISKSSAIDKLVKTFRLQANTAASIINAIPAANVVPAVEFNDCRNELCFRCGEYKNRHNGACRGCRWLH